MSHLTIKRKRTESLRSKIYSEQSKNLPPRHSLGRILNDNISKRRRTTQNSPDNSQSKFHSQSQFQSQSQSQSKQIMKAMQQQIEQAKQLYRNKNTKNALFLFRKLHKKYPNNSQIGYFLGSCLLNQSQYQSALTYFKNCLQLSPNFNKNIFICMAICYKAQKKLKQAIQILSIGCQRHSQFKDAYFYKGKLHLKLQQFDQAYEAFKKCCHIDPTNTIAILFLADSLKNINLFDEALEKYDYVIQKRQQNWQRALIKKINLLVECKRIKQAERQIKRALNMKLQSSELNFLKGICEYQLGNYSEAATILQLSLASNIPQNQICKAFKYLIQISIKQKDFFGAEHLVSRSKFINLNKDDLSLYYKLVEGINDLIKRRLSQCQQKLQSVYKNSVKQKSSSQKFLFDASGPYYAFCLFSIQKYEKALQIYKACIKKKQLNKKLEQYNTLICEGVVYHKKNEFVVAEQKFRQAFEIIGKKVEPIFLICVNMVQEVRDEINQQNIRKKLISRLQKQFQTAQQINCSTPLFLFYQSLCLLFQGKDACTTIDKAIAISQQEVSQYFFIQALSYSLNGQNLKGLQSISKAIDLDHNIPQFYKQRSKYYYVLERYEQAVSDVTKILSETQDEQARLLLTFYRYMTDEYVSSLQILKDVSQQCSQDKFKQFQMALYFRLHMYDRCGVVGDLINAIVQRKKLTNQFIQNFVQEHIGGRQSYCQFTIYHFHVILSAYYFYQNDHDQCLEHLFGALQQIQIHSESDEYLSSSTEIMLNQIKFNIAIASLKKEQGDQLKKSLQDTCKYIEMFIAETEDVEFIKCMNSLLPLIKQENTAQKINSSEIIDLFSGIPKLSDDFPEVQLVFSSKLSIKTKFLIVYPQKLKFNISPQFDQSFLYNFDIDKVQSKLCPPWFKLHEGQIFFTDKIRNQSVLISQTDKPATPSLVIAPSLVPQSLRQKFKLDDAIEKKLEKIIKARKRSQQQKGQSTTKI